MPNFKNEKKKDNGNNTSTNTESVKAVGSKEYDEENKDYLSLLKSLCENNSQYKRKLRHILMASSMEEAYKNTSFDDLLIISELMADYGRQYLSEHDLITLYILYVANVYTGDSFKSREYSFSQSLGYFSEEAIICVCNLFEKLGDSSLKIYIENMSYSFSITGILIKILLAYKEGKVISDLTPLGIFNITNAFYRNRSNFDKTETKIFLISVIDRSSPDNLTEYLNIICSDINLLRFIFNMFMFSRYRITFVEFIKQLINTDDKFVLDFFLCLAKDSSLLNSFELKYFYNQIGACFIKEILDMYAYELKDSNPKLLILNAKKDYYKTVTGRYSYLSYLPITVSVFNNLSDFNKDYLIRQLMQPAIDEVIYYDGNWFSRYFTDERFEYFDVYFMKYFNTYFVPNDVLKDIDARFKALKDHFINDNRDNKKKSFSDAQLNSPNLLTTQALINLIFDEDERKDSFLYSVFSKLTPIFDTIIDRSGLIGFWNLYINVKKIVIIAVENPELFTDSEDGEFDLTSGDIAILVASLSAVVVGMYLDKKFNLNINVVDLFKPIARHFKLSFGKVQTFIGKAFDLIDKPINVVRNAFKSPGIKGLPTPKTEVISLPVVPKHNMVINNLSTGNKYNSFIYESVFKPGVPRPVPRKANSVYKQPTKAPLANEEGSSLYGSVYNRGITNPIPRKGTPRKGINEIVVSSPRKTKPESFINKDYGYITYSQYYTANIDKDVFEQMSLTYLTFENNKIYSVVQQIEQEEKEKKP